MIQLFLENRMSCGSSRVYLSFGLSVYLLEQHCISQEVAAALLKLDAVVLSPDPFECDQGPLPASAEI